MSKSLIDNLGLYYGKESQHAGGLGIVPIFRKEPSQQSYISLHQAFEQNAIVISEISEGGSVPNLKVFNRGKIPVLILDGEELRGAKQNRVLNTSVLIAGESELVIPVSCTEHGRWSYRSKAFEESGEVLSASIRGGKMVSVTENLISRGIFASDQGKVWNEISELHESLKTKSGTGAMRDAYEQSHQKLEDISGSFPWLEGQCGVYVEIAGHFAGLDFVSSPEIWKDVHEKIVRSYIIDVLGREFKDTNVDPAKLEKLFSYIGSSKFSEFPAVGMGGDVRFEQKGLIGSALLWEEDIIHLASYPKAEHTHTEPYHSPRHRNRDNDFIVD